MHVRIPLLPLVIPASLPRCPLNPLQRYRSCKPPAALLNLSLSP
jgi:hypothetical protein